jgi:uncharacterized protein DUF4397
MPAPDASVIRSRPPRRVAVAAVLGALALLPAGVAGGAAAATSAGAGTASLRLAHFSPDTPKVDVYLSSFSAPDKPTVFPGVGYGTLSPYQQVPAGRYSIGMRLAGALPSTPLVISTVVAAEAGKAYTVAGVGRKADLALQVFHDDLSRPTGGQARLRVIQAADRVPVIDVRDAGAPLAQGTRFATESPYVNLPTGEQNLQLVAPATTAPLASTSLDALPGSVYSLVVLDDSSGVRMLLRTDASGARSAPRGGVAAGLGGLSTADGDGAQSLSLPIAVVAVAWFAAVVLRRRLRSARPQ